jgi:hypothetical protein
MTVLTQPPSMGDALKYELNPNYTRETITLLEGTSYPVGSVLGRITASGKYTLASHGGSDGAETAAAVLLYLVDARLSDAIGVVLVRGPAILSRAALIYDGSVDDSTKISAKIAELESLNILVRDSA